MFGQTTVPPPPTVTPGPAQAPLPVTPSDPAEIFAAAAPLYDFASPTLKPWHMKVSYQLYDEMSKPTTQGTFEYWWASPKTYRTTWTRPGVENTRWSVNGDRYQAAAVGSTEYFERAILSDLEPPVAWIAKQDKSKNRFELAPEHKKTDEVICVVVVSGYGATLAPSQTPPVNSPVYCFDKNHPVLLASIQPMGSSVTYGNLTRVQGLILPKKMSVSLGDRTGLTATVDAVEGISVNAPELMPPTGLAPQKGPIRVAISSGVSAGLITKQVRPEYPDIDRRTATRGTVVLEAVIGTDGHIHDAEVLSAPSQTLGFAAKTAVLQWEYKPYLLNGEPVAVDTTINVVFNVGH